MGLDEHPDYRVLLKTLFLRGKYREKGIELNWTEASRMAVEELAKVNNIPTETLSDLTIIERLQQRQEDLIRTIKSAESGLYKSELLARLDEVESIIDWLTA